MNQRCRVLPCWLEAEKSVDEDQRSTLRFCCCCCRCCYRCFCCLLFFLLLSGLVRLLQLLLLLLSLIFFLYFKIFFSMQTGQASCAELCEPWQLTTEMRCRCAVLPCVPIDGTGFLGTFAVVDGVSNLVASEYIL